VPGWTKTVANIEFFSKLSSRALTQNHLCKQFLTETVACEGLFLQLRLAAFLAKRAPERRQTALSIGDFPTRFGVDSGKQTTRGIRCKSFEINRL
jgi:hypothetical protein